MNSDQYVLLVEDDLDISEAIESILIDEHYQVKCAYNGKEALDYLHSTKIIPSLILLDIMMPFMNGYEFREAQLHDPRIANIPTIVLSATGKQDDALKLHFNDTLKKPLDLSTLIYSVEKNFKHQ
jgi:CheY-like chemotaxis protein